MLDYRRFTKKELAGVLEIIHASMACRDELGLRSLLERLKDLVSGDYSVCGIGEGGPTGLSETPRVINGSYPLEWLKIYGEEKFYFKDPVIWNNFQNPGAQLWEDTFKIYSEKLSGDFISKARDFGLCHGLSGGMFDRFSGLSTIFTFAGTRRNFGHHQKEIISMLSPHLHQALVRIYKDSQKVTSEPLSNREGEVMRWMKEGKTNWEISVILSISERTVKFHVQNIEKKLNAVNKAHAIAIAMEQSLVS